MTASQAEALRLGGRIVGVVAAAVPVFLWPTLMQGADLTFMMQVMVAVGLGGVVVSAFGWALAMVAAGFVSFVPVGLYMLGGRNESVLIGLSNVALLVAAGVVHAGRVRRGPAEPDA